MATGSSTEAARRGGAPSSDPRRRRPWALALLLTACPGQARFTLPDPAPEGELVFAVLYDDRGRVTRIGETARRASLYAGRYVLEDDDGDLVPRLYFVQLDDLQAAASAACAELDTARARTLCDSVVARCADAPLDCLTAVRADTACGPRLTLPDVLPISGYVATEDRGFSQAGSGDAIEIARGLVLCGPVPTPPCPALLPRVLLLVEGASPCVAQVDQRVCAVSIDGPGCGLPRIEGELDEGGAFAGAPGSACTLTPAAAPEAPAAAERAYTLSCPDRAPALVVPTDPWFVTRACERSGPLAFDTGLEGARVVAGAISGLVPLSPPGWSPRWAFTGAGIDECAELGCRTNGEDCEQQCGAACQRQFTLNACARDDWPDCIGASKRTACELRCRQWCASPPAGCFDLATGLSIALAPPDGPELDVARFEIDTGNDERPRGYDAIQRVESPGPVRLVAVTLNGFHVFEASEAQDELIRRARVPLGFDISGLTRSPVDPELFYVYGAAGLDPRARLAVVRLAPTSTAGAEVLEGGVPLPDLASADAATFLGDATLAVASVRPPQPTAAPAALQILPPGGGPPTLRDLPSPVSALVGLPGGRAAVGLTSGRLLIIDAEGTLADLAMWPGLVIRDLRPDPTRCSDEVNLTCRIYVGFESLARTEPARVGLVEFPNDDPRSARLRATLAPTSSPSLQRLVVDAEGGQLIAVDAHHNRLTPFTLVD